MAHETNDSISSLRNRIDTLRRELLDLTLRNPLLNHRVTRGRGVEVVDATISQVAKVLVSGERQMVFLPAPDDSPTNAQASRTQRELHLPTAETEIDLHRRLLNSYRLARSSIEETGVNVLFLALGALKWYDSPSSQPRRAPLILVPVELTRSEKQTFRLSRAGDDPGVNLPLIEKLRSEFGIALPGEEALSPEDAPDISNYIAKVAAVIRREAPTEWEVDADLISLGFFSYHKLVMYRDLEHSSIEQSDTIAALLGGRGFDEPPSDIEDDKPLDIQLTPDDVHHVMDADSSQIRAIHDGAAGRNMVVIGPPGTGKSQTIVNLLAELVSKRKRILFVSEKMAALDVVKRRLDNLGLGGACLELHNHRSNKRDVLAELKRTMESSDNPSVRNAPDRDALAYLQQRLNGYAEAMNTPLGSSEVSPSDAYGRLLSIDHDGTLNPLIGKVPRIPDWTESEFKEARQAFVEPLLFRMKTSGAPKKHPFWGSRLQELSIGAERELSNGLSVARDAYDLLIAKMNDVAGALDLPQASNLLETEHLLDAAKWTTDGRGTRGLDLDAPAWESHPGDIKRLVDLGLSWREMRHRRATAALDALQRLAAATSAIAEQLRVAAPTTEQEVEDLLLVVQCAIDAPNTTGLDMSSPLWETSALSVARLLECGLRQQHLHVEHDVELSPHAWDTDLTDARRVIAAKGRGLLRWFSSEYRGARDQFAAVLRGPLPKGVDTQLVLMDAIAEEQTLWATINSEHDLITILGDRWNRRATDWTSLEPAIRWWMDVMAEAAAGRISPGALALLRQITLPAPTAASGFESLAKCIEDYRQCAQNLNEVLEQEEATGIARRLDEWRTIPFAEQRTFLTDLAETGLSSPYIGQTNEGPDAMASEMALLISKIEDALGSHWHWYATEWERVAPAIQWWLSVLANHKKSGNPSGDAVAHMRVVAGRAQIGGPLMSPQTTALAEAIANFRSAMHDVGAAMEIDFQAAMGGEFASVSLSDVYRTLQRWADNIPRLRALASFNAAAEAAERGGLRQVADVATEHPDAVNLLTDWFTQDRYVGIIEHARMSRSELRDFDSIEHEDLVQKFRELDKSVIRDNQRRIAADHSSQTATLLLSLSNQYDRSIADRRQQLRFLRYEMGKQRRHKPIRTLLQEAGPLVQALKPIFMMSPLSVASYLTPGAVHFDVVVFDEASQVRPADALGALARANKAVVVGDNMQLPPTTFFERAASDDELNEDENPAGDLESILDLFMSKGAPERRLRWHYRSRHESLIALSNQRFYENRLMVLPSPSKGMKDVGLRFHHLPQGVYDRGREARNPFEADAVAQAVMAHARERSHLSLGVAAFSAAQADAIFERVEALRQMDDSAEGFFTTEHPEEPFFIKNLENVQGDERDVIFISIGYGRDIDGRVSMNFGPLNKQGGERRLNVLITRAKIQCHVFTNLLERDIDLSKSSATGVKELKDFLRYAQTGQLSTKPTSGPQVDSPFQEEVARRLLAKGYTVEQEVGVGGKFVDIGIVDPENPDRYLIGIECDGATYHSSRTARERDRLRQQQLEGLGWTLHRIWGPDWYHHPEEELFRVIEAIERARAARE